MLASRSVLIRGAALLSSAALLGILAAPPAAFAQPTSPHTARVITASQEADIRTRMTSGGISPSIQQKLIDKLRRGELPLALTDAKPARVFTETHGAVARQVYEYADGSRVWVDQSAVDGAASTGLKASASAPPSLTGCVLAPGAWFVGCKVSVTDPISSAGFIIDLKRSSVNKAQLRDFRGKFCLNSVGGCTVTGGIVRSTQSASGPAWARLTYTANIFGVPASQGEIGIRISGTSVSTYG